MGEGGGQGWEKARLGGRRQKRGTEKIPKETLGRKGNGFGDIREGMKEEVRGNGRVCERTPNLRPGSQNTQVGGDGATRPKRGHRVGWGRLAVRAP